MKATAMLEALEDAANRLDVRVSYEALASIVGHGGLCRVRGQYRVIIDKRATTEERVATLAQSLARVAASTDTAALGLPEAARELVDYYADGSAARKAPAPARRAS